MPTAPETRPRLFPSAIPLSEAEQAQWDALSDEERLRLYNEMLNDPADNMTVEDTMDDILAEGRARFASRRA